MAITFEERMARMTKAIAELEEEKKMLANLEEVPVGYLIDIAPYCDHKAVTDYLCRKLPHGVPDKHISNIRLVYTKKGKQNGRREL